MHFFQTPDNKNTLASFNSTLAGLLINEDGNTRNEKVDVVRQTISAMIKSADEWDKNTPFNIENIGQKFIDNIQSFDPKSDKDALTKILVMCYRFICEYEIFLPMDRMLGDAIKPLKIYVERIQDSLPEHEKGIVKYTTTLMPLSIVRYYIHHENLNNIKQFNNAATQAKTFSEEWTKEIKQKQLEVNSLKNTLEELKAGYNFVGLHQGFARITEEKKKEKNYLKSALIFMGIVLLSPLIAELFLTLGDEAQTSATLLKMNALYKILPLMALEIILIYFFRIILMNYQSVKAQILQLELRKTLCEFIQHYSEYSSKIKSKDPESLVKFENLIFSGLVANSEKLPSTYDGIDQLIKLANVVKGTKSKQ